MTQQQTEARNHFS